MNKKSERPASVIVAAVFEIITGAVFLLGGTELLLFTGIGSPTLQVFGAVHIPFAASFLILGVFTAVSPRHSVWIFGVALSILSIVDDIAGFTVVQLPFHGVVGTGVVLVTAMIVLSFLGRADARSYMTT